MAISSYGAATDSSASSGSSRTLDINIAGRDVLVVEDIIDSGLTLSYLMRSLRRASRRRSRSVPLLTSPSAARSTFRSSSSASRSRTSS